MTPDAQQPSPFNDLAYATGRWEIYRQDAGMGEKDYCVLRNGGFFCRTDDLNAAKNICAAIDKFRPHTPAPERIIIGKQTCEAFDDAKFPVFVQGTGWISLKDAERMFAHTAARTATLAAQKEYLEILNSELPDYDCRARLKHLIRESLRRHQAGEQQ